GLLRGLALHRAVAQVVDDPGQALARVAQDPLPLGLQILLRRGRQPLRQASEQAATALLVGSGVHVSSSDSSRTQRADAGAPRRPPPPWREEAPPPSSPSPASSSAPAGSASAPAASAPGTCERTWPAAFPARSPA